MRKSRIFIFLSVFLVLVLLATGLFACKKDPVVDPAEGRVVAVASAMDTIYSAMVASDGSLQTNYFTLKSTGSYSSGEDVYDVDFAGTFDITQSNGASAADNRSQMLFEVKRGGIEVFLLYYKEGSLYVDFPPYARCLDDWPLYNMLAGLRIYGDHAEFIRLLAGHLALHQSRGTFFAPEMSFRDRLDSTSCIPSQMTLPLAVRYLLSHITSITQTGRHT